jgi:hypothetical protein
MTDHKKQLINKEALPKDLISHLAHLKKSKEKEVVIFNIRN